MFWRIHQVLAEFAFFGSRAGAGVFLQDRVHVEVITIDEACERHAPGDKRYPSELTDGDCVPYVLHTG